ncbi:MAG: Holliday junction branch migration protein RuvA [Victivallales bacterium]|nr:Holliday junction branch migration protein RuvA [Victivallales bacterium]MCF7888559.1 Holliday junction branch migration protein RuvA [Victivallales bacterium]
MIGKITGKLDTVSLAEVLVDVNGVYYEIIIPLSTYDKLPREGENVELFTYLYVREDEMTLYGFASLFEKGLYKILISASGIGPKLGIKILSSISVHNFCEYVTNADTKSLSKINGLGKKTSERLVIELREKIIDFAPETLYDQNSEEAALSRQAEEAALALVQLGFKYETAKKAVKKAASKSDEATDSECLIRLALQNLSS